MVYCWTGLFNAIALILFIASLGSGLAGQVGAARLLFAMGRDGVLPRKIFTHLDSKSTTPNYNIIIMGVLTIIGSLVLSYQSAAELINFGAFLAFMGVNIASFRQFYLLRTSKEKRSVIRDAMLPILGFLVCLSIWLSLPNLSKILGGIWFIVGLVYLMIKTNGFRKAPVILDFKEV